MPAPGYLQLIDQAVLNWSIELSPESHDEAIRRLQDETTFYSNAEIETVIQAALALRCHRIDVFFMIGLPGQTKESVIATIRYCEHLFKNSDRRLSCFISPMGPFLDPGSRGFEAPAEFGYRMFAHTLEEHRQLLIQPSWQQILNYETRWMSRAELVEATYDAAEALNALKLNYGRIDQRRGQAVARRITQARSLLYRLNAFDQNQKPDLDTLRILQGDIHTFSISTVCDKRELFWRRHLLNFKLTGLGRIVLAYLGDQIRQVWRDRVGQIRKGSLSPDHSK
jgi:radical SAM superfamily enzyme YgiQ (UPF0313 family)